MHRADTDHVRFAAQLRVHVPRNTAGDLDDGVVELLERVDAVEDVEDVELAGLLPRLNDLAVDAHVEGRLRLEPEVEDAQEFAREVLANGFGIAEVQQCYLHQIPELPREPILEYG